jgi:valyl-tRNA synthetase
MPTELPKQYDHTAAQERWYKFWEEKGYFHSEPDPERKRFPKGHFTIVIPPPNVTGALHLGHALNNSLQDILVRFKRMQGFNTLWMPGTDHAGIATQAVVERRLLEEEKKTRHDLGREKLVERIWKWKDEYEARIIGQLKQMGCSCDWARTRFTLDEICARAVRHTFFHFFKEGLIYRGKRLVNWDTFLQTAVSDDEVFHETVQGHFWHIRYPVIDPQPGEPAHVTVATTRPETMLGDTAVAVHPDPAKALHYVEIELLEDLGRVPPKERPDIEKKLDAVRLQRERMLAGLEKLRDMARAGRKVMLPLLNRPIPLICDEWAKPELGSGCVKITPAHDPNDYDVWQRHPEIGAINILNADGTLNEAAGRYQWLTVLEARKKVVADLESQGLLEAVEDREIDLAHSDRSKTPIEPYLSDQWFVKMSDFDDGRPGLAEIAMRAVREGRVKFFPERYAKSYLDWLGEKRDWCVSRNLWWGHRIPVWFEPGFNPKLRAHVRELCKQRPDEIWVQPMRSLAPPRGGEHLVYMSDMVCVNDGADDIISDLEAKGYVQDDSVLDTWFSSALWPHSTLGWPEQTAELKYYYPTSVLVTSRDIITLWVARMVLTGLHNCGEVPFREVYITTKILDRYGETMSKSKGNGIDPLDVIEKSGADALRFGIAHLATETQDARMPAEFECPHCGALIEQTKDNRMLPRVKCAKCGKPFSTQWANKPDDKALARGLVVSERFELGRNFCNKLWNAARFTLLNLEGYTAAPVRDDELAIEDRWILSRLATVTRQVTEALERYAFADAARTLYDFAWDEFCSFYVEMAKYRLQKAPTQPVAQRVLAHTLDTLLRLLHPIIPFLTEEVWQLLREVAPERGLAKPVPAAESIMIAPWPEADLRRQDAQIEARFARFQDVLRGIREIRARQNIAPKQAIDFVVRCDAATADLLKPMAPYFETMAAARTKGWGRKVDIPTPSASFSLPNLEVFVDLADLIDVPAELAKNEKERQRLIGLIAGKEKKLSNESFVSRAPADVVQKERDGLTELQSQLKSVESMLSQLRGSKA